MDLDFEPVAEYLGETIFLRVDGYYFCEFQKQYITGQSIDYVRQQMNNIAAPKLYQAAKDLLKNFGIERYTDVFDVHDMNDEIKTALERKFKDMLENM